MKKFIKERNPFLLISFIFSILVLILICYLFTLRFDIVKNLMTPTPVQEYYIDLTLISFYTILFVFFVLVSLFNIVGFLYKKEEYIFVSIGLLVFLSSILLSHSFSVFFAICVAWCIINVLGLMKRKK